MGSVVCAQKRDLHWPYFSDIIVPLMPNFCLKVLVTYIQNASNYFVRLLEHKDSQGRITKYSSDFAPLVMAMNIFYHIPANKQKVNGLYV